MIKIFKRKINQIFNFFGFSIVGIKERVTHNNYDAIISFLIKEIVKEEKPKVFDVGANVGQSIDRFTRLFKDSEIFSFEPTPDVFEKLKEKYQKKINVKLLNVAVDNNAGKKDFYSYRYNKINSLVPADKESKFYKSREIISDQNNNVPFEDIIAVETKTLDGIIDELKIDKIDVIKIDTQGNENRILEGGQNALKTNKIKIIEVELVLGFAYKHQMSFLDIEKILDPFGYKLIAIDKAHNLISASNYQVNCIYVNSEVFEKIKSLHSKNSSIKHVMSKVDRTYPFSY